MEDHCSLPALRTLCLKRLLSTKFIPNQTLLAVLSVVPLDPAVDPAPLAVSQDEFNQLRYRLLTCARERFPMLLERVDGGADAMKKLLGERVFSMLLGELKATEKAKGHLTNMRSGSVLKPTKVVLQRGDSDGGQYYPFEALVAGADWPEGVDPTKRESYLRDSDFTEVFGFSRAEFVQMDRHKQLFHKKRVRLF